MIPQAPYLRELAEAPVQYSVNLKRAYSDSSDDLGALNDGDDLEALDELNNTNSKWDLESQDKISSASLVGAPLTSHNLYLHTLLENPSAEIAMAPGSEKSVATKTYNDARQALRDFGVHFRTYQAPPKELQSHITSIVERVREAKSPTAQQLAKRYPAASKANESTVVGLVAPFLLFEDMLHRGSDGEHHIIRKNDINFDSRWVYNGATRLAAPRPDVALGYILNEDTCGVTTALFTEDEERILLKFAVNADLLDPFITCQMKSAFGNMPTADIQTTRDAIAVLAARYALHSFPGVSPTPVDLHHWSVTCDGRMAYLWLHWAVLEKGFGLRHYMTNFVATALDGGDKRLEDMRMYLRNILGFARDERVARLKHIAALIKHNESKIAKSYETFTDPGFVEGSDGLNSKGRMTDNKSPQTPRRPPQTSPGSNKRSRTQGPQTLQTPLRWNVRHDQRTSQANTNADDDRDELAD